MHSDSAENILVGTFLAESLINGQTYLRQLGGGPALGPYQMEPATHDDIFYRYFSKRPAIAGRVKQLLANAPGPIFQLASNLAYATAMCRVRYWMAPRRLPEADDIEGLAAYWKQHYNTPLGAGTAPKFVLLYKQHGK